jgi:hypothetical protein
MLRLRRADRCCACRAALDVGEQALWDPVARTVTCGSCICDGSVFSGEPGGSAAAEARRRRASQADRQGRFRAAHPIRSRFSAVLNPKPDAGKSFAAGAKGEQTLGAALDRLADAGLLALHDRRLPKSTANIDHLVVAPAGVWVIDAKRYSGNVTWHLERSRGQDRLRIKGRDATQLLVKLDRQLDAVRHALRHNGYDSARVLGALCFVDTEISLLQKQLEVGGRLVTWPRALVRCLSLPGPLNEPERVQLRQVLARSFAPAVRPG